LFARRLITYTTLLDSYRIMPFCNQNPRFKIVVVEASQEIQLKFINVVFIEVVVQEVVG
jgi:hypothetical protein